MCRKKVYDADDVGVQKVCLVVTDFLHTNIIGIIRTSKSHL
jgi:hypothetical protein